jgi:hypothetical protein
MKNTLLLSAVLIIAGLTGSAWTSRETGFQKEKWVNLCNGKDLSGWKQLGGKANYRVENGIIIGTTVPDSPNSFLVTEKNYGNFILELEVKVDTGLNSGIQIRSHSKADYKDGRVHGYQVEIDPSSRAYSGGIYDEARRGWLVELKDNEKARKAFKNGEWNKMRIEAIGPKITTFVNGVKAAELTDSMDNFGFIGLQVHSTRKPDPMEVQWRNIRLQPR